MSQLRAFLTELFDHLTEMNGTDDTEDEEDDIDAEAYREEDTPEPDPEDAEDEDEFGSRRMFLHLQQLASARGNRPVMLPTNPPPPQGSEFFPRQRPTRAVTHPTLAELRFDEPTTSRGAPNRLLPAAGPVAGPSRAVRQTPRGVADMLPIIETSHSPPPSDVASNRSGRTNTSNGGGFFRTYQEPTPGSPRNGALTPDLNYAEIGHGRGTQSHANQVQHTPRRGEGHVPHHRPPFIEVDSSQSIPSAGSTMMDSATSQPPAGSAQTTQTAASSVVWPYREPASPASPTSRELQESVQSALGGGEPRETRGRSVKRSLRNTLNAAEQYASSLIFGRRSPPVTEDGSGPSHASGSGAGGR